MTTYVPQRRAQVCPVCLDAGLVTWTEGGGQDHTAPCSCPAGNPYAEPQGPDQPPVARIDPETFDRLLGEAREARRQGGR